MMVCGLSSHLPARPPPFVVLANNPHPKFQGADIDDENTKGIIPRIIEQIFQSIMISPANMEFTVKVSYMEIYMEKVRDLLNRKFLLFTQLWSKYATQPNVPLELAYLNNFFAYSFIFVIDFIIPPEQSQPPKITCPFTKINQKVSMLKAYWKSTSAQLRKSMR